MVDVGSVVAGYRLVELLGTGPFGRSYRAEDARGSVVAIKLLKPGFLARMHVPSAFGRLAASISVHAQLAHPYLARTYFPVEDHVQQAYGQLSELLPGVPFVDAVGGGPADLQGRDPRALASLLTCFEQLGDVLIWIHGQGMVHGNLKPSNVMLIPLQGEYHVKLLDLSWSAIGVAAVPKGPTSFVSPEQYAGAVPTPQSDQWAMGTMLERALTRGQHPLSLGVLPAALVHAVQRATRESPAERFSTMMECVESIREIRLDLLRGAGADIPPSHGAATVPAGTVPRDLAQRATVTASHRATLPLDPVHRPTLQRPGPASDLRAEAQSFGPDAPPPSVQESPEPEPSAEPNGGVPSAEPILSDDLEAPRAAESSPSHVRPDESDPGRTDEEDRGRGPLRRHAVGNVLDLPAPEEARAAASESSPGGPDDPSPPESRRLPPFPAAPAELDRPGLSGSSSSPLESAKAEGSPESGASPSADTEARTDKEAHAPSETPQPNAPPHDEDARAGLSPDPAPAEAQAPELASAAEVAKPPRVAFLAAIAALIVLFIGLGFGVREVGRTPTGATWLEELKRGGWSGLMAVWTRTATSTPSKQTAPPAEGVHAPPPVPTPSTVPGSDDAIEAKDEAGAPPPGEPSAPSDPLERTPTDPVDRSVRPGQTRASGGRTGILAREGPSSRAPLEADPDARECASGDPRACLRLGRVRRVAGEEDAAIEAYVQGCSLGASVGCLRAAGILVRRSDGAARALELFVAGCEAGMAQGCYRASRLAGRRRARLLEERACALGREESCVSDPVPTATTSATTSGS